MGRAAWYQSFDDGYYAETRSAIMRKSGIRGAVQQERWALGLDVVYGAVNASRHDEFGTPDNSRFIRDFDLPFAGSFNPIVGDRTIGARGLPGRCDHLCARPFSWITLGGRFGFRQETEDRRIADPYDLDVESRSTEYTAGAVIRPPKIGRVVQLAGFGQLVQSNIVAKSESP